MKFDFKILFVSFSTFRFRLGSLGSLRDERQVGHGPRYDVNGPWRSYVYRLPFQSINYNVRGKVSLLETSSFTPSQEILFEPISC